MPEKLAASLLLLLLPSTPLGLGVVHVEDFVDSASLTYNVGDQDVKTDQVTCQW